MSSGVLVPCPQGQDVTPGDVWLVDAGVCLLSGSSNAPCNGRAEPNLDTVTCPCPPAWSGDPLCTSCGAHFSGSLCESCDSGYWGLSCTACSACNLAHGTCDGSGTQGGTGKCKCSDGYSGDDCTTAPSNTDAKGSSKKLSPGAAFGISLLVIFGVAAVGAFVFARYYGGGPTLKRWTYVCLEGAYWCLGKAAQMVKTLISSAASPTPAKNSYTQVPFRASGTSAGERTSLLGGTAASAPNSTHTAGDSSSSPLRPKTMLQLFEC